MFFLIQQIQPIIKKSQTKNYNDLNSNNNNNFTILEHCFLKSRVFLFSCAIYVHILHY